MTETDPPLDAPVDNGIGELPGSRLRAAREARGLSVEDVALRLNISVTYVRALEASDFDKLPGMAFVKGYTRAYARFVGLSPDELIQEVNQLTDRQRADRPVASINKVGQQARLSDPLIRVSVMVFAAALIGISLWWWQGQTQRPLNEEPATVVDQAQESAPAVDADPTDIQRRLREREGDEAALDEEEEVLPVEGADEAEPSYMTPEDVERLAREMGAGDEPDLAGEVAVPEPAVAEKRLTMTFSGECWVSIRDLDDNLLYASNKKAGEVMEFLVEEPAVLLVGRVSAVSQAEFDGQPLDLDAVAQRNVARLTLE